MGSPNDISEREAHTIFLGVYTGKLIANCCEESKARYKLARLGVIQGLYRGYIGVTPKACNIMAFYRLLCCFSVALGIYFTYLRGSGTAQYHRAVTASSMSIVASMGC